MLIFQSFIILFGNTFNSPISQVLSELVSDQLQFEITAGESAE